MIKNNKLLLPKSIWILTDGKIGDKIQCIGIAENIGCSYEFRDISPNLFFSYLLPFGIINPKDHEKYLDSPISLPFPDMVIASGRKTVLYLKRIKNISKNYTFTVFLKNPYVFNKNNIAHIIWIPSHDNIIGNNVINTITGPHPFSKTKINKLKNNIYINKLLKPRIAVLIGGNNKYFNFDQNSIMRVIDGLIKWKTVYNANYMITTSRRTPKILKILLNKLNNLIKGIYKIF